VLKVHQPFRFLFLLTSFLMHAGVSYIHKAYLRGK
jgi:hypothetical protein